MSDDVRTLVVGATELVWARATERFNQDMSAATVELRTVLNGVPSSWAAPNQILHPHQNVIRAAMLVTAGTPGTYKVQMRVADSPESAILDCGIYKVVNP